MKSYPAPRQSGITAVPLAYRGETFRSTLEADWACTLDRLGIVWQYEPEAVRLPSGAHYLPDFYLPAQDMWAEVKGPTNARLDKTVELAQALRGDEPHPHYDGQFMRTSPVVILRPPVLGNADWEGPFDESWTLKIKVHGSIEHPCLISEWQDTHDRNWWQTTEPWGLGPNVPYDEGDWYVPERVHQEYLNTPLGQFFEEGGIDSGYRRVPFFRAPRPARRP